MRKKSIVFLTILTLTSLVSVPLVCSQIVEVHAEEIPSIDDEVRMPVMNLYGDTKTSMAFTWNTTNFNNSDLQIVKKEIGSFNGGSVITTRGTVEKSKVPNDGFIHRVVVEELEPDTEYLYRIGDVELKSFAETGSFKTSSNSHKDFSFIHMSDPQGWEEEHYDNYLQAVTLASSNKPNFFAITGDIVNNSWLDHVPVLEQWEWALTKTWTIFKDYPVATVAGNHDEAVNDFPSRYTYKNPDDNTLGSGTYYSFDYEDVHFTCINTNDSGGRKSESEAFGLSDKQLNWIKQDLKEHQSSRFRIVLQHKGLFDAGAHCSNTTEEDYDIAVIRKQLAPVYTEYNVDLVLQGHDHLYSLSYPVIADQNGDYVSEHYSLKTEERSDNVSARNFTDVKGTIYFNTGTASGSKYYADSKLEETYHILDVDDSQKKMFTEISISNGKLSADTYAVSNKTKNLVHSFSIDKGNIYGAQPANNGWIYVVIAFGSVAVLTGVGVSIFFIIRKKKRK